MENERSMEEIFRETSSYIYSLSYRLTGSRDEAGDLMQETYLRAMQKLHQVRDARNPVPWLRRICVNIFIDTRRKNRAKYNFKTTPFPDEEHQIISDALTPEQEVVLDEDVQKIRSQCYTILTSSLCLNQRIVFVLIDIFMMDAKDVSRIIGKSGPSVKSLLYRARRKMSRFLGPHCSLVNHENLCRCRSWVSFSHDIRKRRELLAEILNGTDRHADISKTGSRLHALFSTLPYLVPSKNFPDRPE